MTEASFTEEGRVYAVSVRKHSLVARVALEGASSTGSEWPDTHVTAAIGACNDLGRRAVAEAAFLATYEGPWGLKASAEDTLLSILRAVRPDLGLEDSAEGIYAIHGDERFVGLAVSLYDLGCDGLTPAEVVRQFLPVMDEVLA